MNKLTKVSIFLLMLLSNHTLSIVPHSLEKAGGVKTILEENVARYGIWADLDVRLRS